MHLHVCYSLDRIREPAIKYSGHNGTTVILCARLAAAAASASDRLLTLAVLGLGQGTALGAIIYFVWRPTARLIAQTSNVKISGNGNQRIVL